MPDLPPAEAVIVAVTVPAAIVGAVNVAVAKPLVVWENGVIVPLVVAKLTVVPSGTRVPAAVVTVAVTLEVPAEAIDCGFGNNRHLIDCYRADEKRYHIESTGI